MHLFKYDVLEAFFGLFKDLSTSNKIRIVTVLKIYTNLYVKFKWLVFLRLLVNFILSSPAKKMLDNKPRFVSIQGNIGSGKSTVLKIIRENFPELTILDEPLTEWQNVGEKKDINLLGLYYNKPDRWGFTFQIYAFMSRLNKWTEYSKMTGKGIRISERSLLSDRFIFASIMRDMVILDEAEHSIYLQFYDHLVNMNHIVDLFGIIYIQCAPQICDKRIKKRSREGEDTIPVDYLQKIHNKHQQWLNSEKQNKNEKVLIIDNTVPINKQKMVETIGNWLKQRTKN